MKLYLWQLPLSVEQHLEISKTYVVGHPADCAREDTFRDEIAPLDDNASVSRAYGGMAGGVDDNHDGMGCTKEDSCDKDVPTCYVSFMASNCLTDSIHHYHFRLEGPLWTIVGNGTGTVYKLREHPMIQEAKRTLIAILGPGALNSARGGLCPSWRPSVNDLLLRDTLQSPTFSQLRPHFQR